MTESVKRSSRPVKFAENDAKPVFLSVLQIPAKGVGAEVGDLDSCARFAGKEEGRFDNAINATPSRPFPLESSKHARKLPGLMLVIVHGQDPPMVLWATTLQESLEAHDDLREALVNRVGPRAQMVLVDRLREQNDTPAVVTYDAKRLVKKLFSLSHREVNERLCVAEKAGSFSSVSSPKSWPNGNTFPLPDFLHRMVARFGAECVEARYLSLLRIRASDPCRVELEIPDVSSSVAALDSSHLRIKREPCPLVYSHAQEDVVAGLRGVKLWYAGFIKIENVHKARGGMTYKRNRPGGPLSPASRLASLPGNCRCTNGYVHLSRLHQVGHVKSKKRSPVAGLARDWLVTSSLCYVPALMSVDISSPA